jgi:glutaredoxin 3
MKPVEVYTTNPCPYCTRAKELLKRRNIPFKEIPLSWDDESGWKEAEKRSGGMKTMPQIFIDGKIVGGYTELAALDAAGELMKQVAE